MFVETIDFLSGERKILSGNAVPIDPCETVVINSARYELVSCGTSLILENGECEISENDKSRYQLLLGIDKKGSYELTVTLEIGRETIKKRVNIKVR